MGDPGGLPSMGSHRVGHDWSDLAAAAAAAAFYWASQVELMVENLPANSGDREDTSLIPGSGRSPGGGHGNPLQYSCLENPMDRRAWQPMVHRVKKSQTWLKQLSSQAQHWGKTSVLRCCCSHCYIMLYFLLIVLYYLKFSSSIFKI